MSLLWIVPTPDQDPDAADPQFKLVTSSTLAVFDFGNWDELEPDDSTLAATPTPPTVAASPGGLTLGTPTLLGAYRVQVPVSGGTAGVSYVLTCTARTGAGETLIGRGTLLVR